MMGRQSEPSHGNVGGLYRVAILVRKVGAVVENDSFYRSFMRSNSTELFSLIFCRIEISLQIN